LAAAIGLTPNRLVLLIAGVLIAYFVVITLSNATHNASLAEEQRVLERETSALAGSLTELHAVEKYVRSEEFVEGVARNQLNLVRPGEVLVKVLPSEQGESEPPEGPPSPWWERLFGR
jgi:cell division protein FtsB